MRSQATGRRYEACRGREVTEERPVNMITLSVEICMHRLIKEIERRSHQLQKADDLELEIEACHEIFQALLMLLNVDDVLCRSLSEDLRFKAQTLCHSVRSLQIALEVLHA